MTTLQTNRFLLRSTDDTDAEFLNELASREEVRTFIGGLRTRKEDSYYFTVLEAGTRVGHVALVRAPPPRADLELICAVLQCAEGRGVATESCRRLLRWAFEHLSVPRVVGRVQFGNDRSIGLVQRLEMSEFAAHSGNNDRYFEAIAPALLDNARRTT